MDYSVGGFDHTLQARFSPDSSALEAASFVSAFLSAVESQLFTITVLGARVRDAGGSVSYPVDWDGDDVYGSGDDGAYTSALYMDFVGRSLDGRRCRVAVFGSKAGVDLADKNFRFSSVVSWVAGGIAALEALPGTPCSISGESVRWQQYANTGMNAYWRNKIR